MLLHGIEVTKFRWNDKEVSVEEYHRLNEEWLASNEKELSSVAPPEKKSRKTKK